jgi:RNA polymerase sigma-70 factor (ECF subfamily)
MDDWTEVYERHGALVWATVYRVLDNEAESLDCCQDIFIELIQRTTMQSVRNWPAFLKWLATRRAIDLLRQRRNSEARFEDVQDLASTTSDASTSVDDLVSDELCQRVKYELARLPSQQAEAFWLVSVERMSYDEIADQLMIEANHVGVLVHRARKKLREKLADLKPVSREG